MGRRNTQIGPAFVENKGQKLLARIEQPERYPGWVLAGSVKQIASSREGLGGSTDWIALHRPVELAAVTGHL
jgi:hypothetical protein